MQQALHIFKKDVRYLRIEIALVLVLVFAFTPLWPVAVVYLIARLIHAEAIPGDNQFWLTRPYSRTSLIAAKLLFILAFVNLPFFLLQTYQFIQGGFGWQTHWPGLLWSQCLMFLCLCLPAAALAAITPGLVVFMFAQLILVAIYVVLGNTLASPSAHQPWPAGVEWMSNTLIVLISTVVAMSMLALQYYRRKTPISAAMGAATVAVVISIVFFLPPQPALNAEISLTDPAIDTKSMQLAQSPSPMQLVISSAPRSPAQLKIPLDLIHVPPGIDIRVDGITGVFQAQSGTTLTTFNNGADTSDSGTGTVTIKSVFRVEHDFLEAEMNRPGTLRATVYVTLFGDAKSQTIPQQPESVTVLDRFRCSTVELEHLVEHRCTSWFRWPGQMIYAQIDAKDPVPFYRSISYSPFPAELNLVPREAHTALNSQGLAPPSPFGEPATIPSVTIVAKRPVAHFRRDIELRGILFGQLIDGPTMWMRKPPPPPKARK